MFSVHLQCFPAHSVLTSIADSSGFFSIPCLCLPLWVLFPVAEGPTSAVFFLNCLSPITDPFHFVLGENLPGSIMEPSITAIFEISVTRRICIELRLNWYTLDPFCSPSLGQNLMLLLLLGISIFSCLVCWITCLTLLVTNLAFSAAFSACTTLKSSFHFTEEHSHLDKTKITNASTDLDRNGMDKSNFITNQCLGIWDVFVRLGGLSCFDFEYVLIRACVARLMTCARHLTNID